MENVKILTVGAGAVGAYFTGRLAQAGAEVSVVVRSDYEAVRANGFEILSAAGDFHFQPHGVYRSAEEYPDLADYVFLTAKFFPETDEASMLRAAMKNPAAVLVLIQNGIGIEDKLAAAFPDHEILSSIAYIGATRLKPGTVQQKGASELKFGRFGGGESAAGRRLEALFSETIGVQAAFVENIAWFRWSKLLWNLPYNPVSVLGGGVDTSRMTDRGPLEALTRALMEEEQPLVITTFDALMDRLVRPEVMESFLLHLQPGDVLDLEALRRRLVGMGYEYNYQVEEAGQFSVRGGILDIFPLTEELAYRIEFWDDEVDSIRRFSPESQRSLESVESLTVYPASELILCEAELKAGVDALTADAKKLYDAYRKEQKTEEAYRVKQAAEAVRIVGELKRNA